jgi:hypothetical protein
MHATFIDSRYGITHDAKVTPYVNVKKKRQKAMLSAVGISEF